MADTPGRHQAPATGSRWPGSLHGAVCAAVADSRDGSAQLVDADQGAGGIAEGAVADPVRLLRRLLDDLGAAGLEPLEGAVEVLGGQHDDRVAALGHHLDDRAALVVGDAGVAAGGNRTMDVPGWSGGPTVIQRIPAYPTSLRTSKPRVSR